jgi:hypothetical protein
MALEYLQTHGIAHRDLRSDNLLINGAGILKIGKPAHTHAKGEHSANEWSSGFLECCAGYAGPASVL